jgi:hypothetical protein
MARQDVAKPGAIKQVNSEGVITSNSLKKSRYDDSSRAMSQVDVEHKKAGLLGLEPRMTESKSGVLPLHHRPVDVCYFG